VFSIAFALVFGTFPSASALQRLLAWLPDRRGAQRRPDPGHCRIADGAKRRGDMADLDLPDWLRLYHFGGYHRGSRNLWQGADLESLG